MNTFPSVDESFGRLQRAGWTAGDLAVHTAGGPRWLVTGTSGENRVEARGATQAEAWHRACEQAAAVGMLARPEA
jgi:hypothetical protein